MLEQNQGHCAEPAERFEEANLYWPAQQVKQALQARGLETPLCTATHAGAQGESAAQKIAKISAHMREILRTLGLDLTDDSLMDTPDRVARMYVEEIFSGLDYQKFPKITLIDNKMQLNEMVRVQDIELTSTCEHHLVAFDGKAHVAYLPNKRLIGLSKINRIVRFFAQRPQVQERLTQQILVALQTLLETEHVAVSLQATHFCIKARGVMDSSSATTTTALGGHFKSNPATRQEFFARY